MINLNQALIIVFAIAALYVYVRWGRPVQNNFSQEEKMIQSFFGLVSAKGLVKAALLTVIAIFFGVTITPAVHLASTATPPLPTILGMTLADFLTWLVSSGIIGVALAAGLAQFNFIPAKLSEYLVPILSAAFGAAITAAVPFIAPDMLGKTVYAVALMLASGVVTWLGTIFTSHAIATLDNYKLRARAHQIIDVTETI